MAQPVRIFFSYAHEDDRWRIQLEKALKLLERQGLVESWHDRKLLPGEDWARGIDIALERAELILFLVSADFLASEYIWGVEMRRALEREAEGTARVVPLILRDCDWHSAPFGRLQALPRDGKAVSSWSDQDAAWAEVARAIRRIVEVSARASAPAAVPGAAPDPRRYLEALEAEHSYVEIRGMGATVAEQLPLDRVYTRLKVAGGVGPGRRRPGGKEALEREAEERSLELPEVLAEHRHAVLVGDPGSGKTTFLRFAAQVLARALLTASPGLAKEKLGLDGEVPFPLFIPLSRLAEQLAKQDDAKLPADAPEHLLRYLDFAQRGHAFGLPAGYLRGRAEAGGCFFLLDGLDEVPGALRPRVAAIVEKWVVAGTRANRHLISCRTRAYAGTARLRTVPSFRLAAFTPAEVAQFVRAWSRALYRVAPEDGESSAADQAEAYRQGLQAAIEAHPHVAPLSESPLMLTMLAVVHWNQRKLPEQRVELYGKAVDYLLDSRNEQSAFPSPLRREALQALALALFEDPEGVQRSLGRASAAAAVAPVLAVPAKEAESYLEAESLHSGLLVSRSEGEVEFWHLSFQEYLAAVELANRAASGGDFWSTLEPHLFDDRWSEVVLLLGGCLRGYGLRAARGYVERILATGKDPIGQARAVGLLGRVLRDLRPYGGDAAAGTAFEVALTETLSLLRPGGPAAPEALRVEVGEALGQAGDPRLEDAHANRVALPGGSFWMGAQQRDRQAPGFDPEAFDDEAPVHRVTVSSFTIGRYPVTVGEFRRFVEAEGGGYLNPRHWDP